MATRRHLLFCVAAATVLLGGGSDGRAGPARSHARKERLLSYLDAAALRLDFYVTTECGDHSAILTAQVEDDQGVTDVNALVAKIREECPGVTVVREERNAAVLHLIDNSLVGANGYGLGKKVSLNFTGTPDELADAIGREVGNVGRCKGNLFPMIRYGDPSTRLKAVVKDQVARDVLSDFLPLSGYSRRLWDAGAVPGTPETRVQFMGPRYEVPAAPRAPKRRPEAFAAGQVAYEVNPDTPRLRADAIEFIEAGLSKDHPLQVRWAMLYLGRYKAQEAIPVLMKYIDYRYTTSAITEASFPAVEALTKMGEPALRPMLDAVGTESSGPRLELLCRAILNVQGDKDGGAAIENEALRSTDVRQAERIRAALGVAKE